MKKILQLVFSLLIFLTAFSGLQAQEEIVYQHPDLDIQFTASSNWNKIAYSAENSSYELVNQNNNMHMKVWYENTNKSVDEFLRKEICMNGMVDEELFATMMDKQHAYGICAVCSEMRRPYKVMLLAIPADNGFYCFRFRCPEECFPEHKAQIQKLLKTVTFSPVVEREVYYALNL